MSYSQRNTGVQLLLRNAREFESDARVRFSGEDRLNEFLGAFRAMIDDLARSSRTVFQLEKIAKRIDEDFENSFNFTVILLAADLVSFTNIDLLAYPGILDTREQLAFGRILRIASRVGLSRNNVFAIINGLARNGYPENEYLEKRLGEIERELESVLKSTEEPDTVSIMRFLGISAHPLKIDNFIHLFGGCNIQHYKEHHISNKRVKKDWEFIAKKLSRKDLNPDGLVIIEEMWDALNDARDALVNIPVGYVDLDAELSVFISALTDIVELANDRHALDQKAQNQLIKNKLRLIIPVLQGYARDAAGCELTGTRSRMKQKIHDSLPKETRIILEPLLVRLVDRYLVDLLDRTPQGQPKFSQDIKARAISFLDIMVGGFIKAIQIGEDLMSVKAVITTELLWPRPFDVQIDPLRISFEFASRLGVKILANRPDWSSERIKKSRLISAAGIQLGFEPNWDELTQLTDEQLDALAMLLSRLVARREVLLSLKDDDSAPLVDAEDCVARFYIFGISYIRWVTDQLIPVEVVPVLRQELFDENIHNIFTNFGFPERLVFFSKRVGSVHRAYRRKFQSCLFSDIVWPIRKLPSDLLMFEIKAGIVHVDDPEKLALRDFLEAICMDYVNFIDLAANKLLSVPAGVIHRKVFNNIFHSLEEFLTFCLRHLEFGTFPGSLDEIRRNATKFESTKKAFEALFPSGIKIKKS